MVFSKRFLASRMSFVLKVSLYTSSFHSYSCEVDKKGGTEHTVYFAVSRHVDDVLDLGIISNIYRNFHL